MLYTLLNEQEVGAPFEKTFYENCFKITISVTKNDDNASQIKLDVCPEDEIGYELLVSFLITVDGTKNWVDYDLWRTKETVFDQIVNDDKFKLAFSLDVHDVLAPKSLETSGGFRNFRVLSSKGEYFVNATSLSELGGSLFKDWYNRECTGETTVVATELDTDEIDILLKACCAYSTIIVTRQNFDVLLQISWKYKIVGVLRAIEQYLLNAKGIHIIAKLDYAYKYKFAMLVAYVLKNVGNKFKRRELLLDYLRKKNMPYSPHHLMDLLELSSLS